MSEEKIKVISAVNGRCVINSRDLGIRCQWPGRGSIVKLTREQIENLMYDSAFSNMVREGYLFIDDMDVKKEVGIEPEDAEKPTIILMDEKELNRFWKIMPFAQFKIEVQNLTKQQLTSLAEYAMKHGSDGTIEKANYLTTVSGYQILKGIELERQIQEA